jgi:hypothetical protein
MQKKNLKDGTILVASDSVDINKTHLHLAPDGTILSDKVDNVHNYKYSNTKKDLNKLWEEITGEKNKFSPG